ncbi:ubiquinol oxidase subunit II [Oleiagrimonas soli]|uniref:Ubiquinol oxidase subunit 2 n=1 Tax=Oleiagrimonas soli TaxID=1543381 RepID=A0A841KGE0_9GAMM|nr:ubiquinol oxidase subunit II [Oleiagrimonas soli]MBB6184246.1 cytochrome o ubiquinol oxidase subunit 2 [Oleiagrimonas soli]
MSVKRLRGLLLLFPALALGGCHYVLLDPSGDVARQQSDLMIASAVLMSLIIVPVLIAVGVIAWRYRASNKKAVYDAEWDHSTYLELIVWAAPLLIIIALGAMTWIGTHQLDPYRPLTRIAEGRAADVKGQPLQVEVVSLKWKWLFFYPQYGIATVNELAAPVDRPIQFKLTSSDMMDSFFVPALAGQIYTMPGMQTVLHAVINKPGDFDGFSANYSGHGFTDMRFRFHGLSPQAFEQWVAKVRAGGHDLDRTAYDQLHQPSRDEPVHYYAHYSAGLYDRILNRCVDPGQMCMSQMMAIDARAAQGAHGEMHMPADASSQAPAHDAATH